MVSVVAPILAALSSAGIVGWSDQYLVLFVAGVCTRAGLVRPLGAAAFIGDGWFLSVVAIAWLLTTLPSLVPHNTLLAAGVNALSGPVSLISGGLFALVSAGVIASARPELATSLYLLGRDARWTQVSSYHPADLALMAGGATMAATLTGVKFAAKPGIALKTGTIGHLSAPMFAVLEALGAVVLTPVLLALEQAQPLAVVLLMALLVAALIALFALSIRWLRAAKRGIGGFLDLLDAHPRQGLAVLAEFLLPGSGWLSQGYIARGLLTLALWALLGLLASTIVGFFIAFPCYLLLARTSAVSLYRRIRRRLDGETQSPQTLPTSI